MSGEAFRVLPLARRPGRDWEEIRRVFRKRPALELGQAWLASREALFRPGSVRLGLSGMSLAVFASMDDRDVFNPVEQFNVPAFPHGDVFEIFLRPAGQRACFEFHVTPGNAILQLRHPEPLRAMVPQPDWDAAGDPLRQWKISRWRIVSQARRRTAGWEVYAEVPLRRIFEEDAPWRGSLLRASFARYDYTRGRLRPVLSSTSPHAAPDFHRQEEWQSLELLF